MSVTVNAGSAKNSLLHNQITPFSDCSFSATGTITGAFYKVDGEVDSWTEIPQGSYSTLLAAVQAFQYRFNNPNNKTVSLQITDNEPISSSSSIIVTVSYMSSADLTAIENQVLNAVALNHNTAGTVGELLNKNKKFNVVTDNFVRNGAQLVSARRRIYDNASDAQAASDTGVISILNETFIYDSNNNLIGIKTVQTL